MKILLALDSRPANLGAIGLLDPHRAQWRRFQIVEADAPFHRRGFRGSTLVGDQLFVVSSAALYRYELNQADQSRPLAVRRDFMRRPEWELGTRAGADLHHVFYSADREALLIANSFMDCVDEVSLSGELRKRHYLWDISESVARIAFARTPDVGDLVHVNHISSYGGRLYLTLGNVNGTRLGKVIRFDDGRVVLDGLEFPHDGFVSDGYFYVSQSGTSEILIYAVTGDLNLIDREPSAVLPVEIRQDHWLGSFQWVRGIAISERHIICGVTQWRKDMLFRPQIPPRLVFFDKQTRQFQGELFLPAVEGFPSPSIFSIHVLPDGEGEELEFAHWERLIPATSPADQTAAERGKRRVPAAGLRFHAHSERSRLSTTWTYPKDAAQRVRVLPDGSLSVHSDLPDEEHFYVRTGSGPFAKPPRKALALDLTPERLYELVIFARPVRGKVGMHLYLIQYDDRKRLCHNKQTLAHGENRMTFRVDSRYRSACVTLRFSGSGVVQLAPLELFLREQ